VLGYASPAITLSTYAHEFARAEHAGAAIGDQLHPWKCDSPDRISMRVRGRPAPVEEPT